MPRTPQAFDVAVIGAGIIGAAIAHHLAEKRLRVVVIDQTGPAAAASGASDGAVSLASKRPGVMARLAQASLQYTAALSRPGAVLAGIFHRRPSFFFASGEAEFEALDNLVTKLGSLDGTVRVVRDGRGHLILPDAGPEAERIVEIAGEGHMLGFEATRRYLAAPRVLGLWPAKVLRWETDAAGVSLSIRRGDGQSQDIRAEWLVVATGTGTSELFSHLPIIPRAGQLIVTERAQTMTLPGVMTAATYLVQKSIGNVAVLRPPVVIDPLATGQYLIGSSREDHDDATRLDLATIRALVGRAVAAWPPLQRSRIIRCFVGVRAATADNLPILGRLQPGSRCVLATGFEGDGICLSALVGRIVAGWIAGEQANDPALARDLTELTPQRFATVHGGAA